MFIFQLLKTFYCKRSKLVDSLMNPQEVNMLNYIDFNKDYERRVEFGVEVQYIDYIGYGSPIVVSKFNRKTQRPEGGDLTIYIDKNFYQLDKVEQKFLILHEVGHTKDPRFEDLNQEGMILDGEFESFADTYAFERLLEPEARVIIKSFSIPMGKLSRIISKKLNNALNSDIIIQAKKEMVVMEARFENAKKYYKEHL